MPVRNMTYTPMDSATSLVVLVDGYESETMNFPKEIATNEWSNNDPQ